MKYIANNTKIIRTKQNGSGTETNQGTKTIYIFLSIPLILSLEDNSTFY